MREMENCKRCGYRWFTRISSPVLCPRCKSPYWFLDKTQQLDKVSKHLKCNSSVVVVTNGMEDETEAINKLDRENEMSDDEGWK
jgi:hypothetical protein